MDPTSAFGSMKFHIYNKYCHSYVDRNVPVGEHGECSERGELRKGGAEVDAGDRRRTTLAPHPTII